MLLLQALCVVVALPALLVDTDRQHTPLLAAPVTFTVTALFPELSISSGMSKMPDEEQVFVTIPALSCPKQVLPGVRALPTNGGVLAARTDPVMSTAKMLATPTFVTLRTIDLMMLLSCDGSGCGHLQLWRAPSSLTATAELADTPHPQQGACRDSSRAPVQHARSTAARKTHAFSPAGRASRALAGASSASPTANGR